MAYRYHKNVPSKINKMLKTGKINAAFISSIHSRKSNCTNLGIVSLGKVYSVFALPNQTGDDPASDTSNALRKVLRIDGRVLIGDEALKFYLDGGDAKDLSEAWHDRTGLPFVFARLCYNKNGKQVKDLVTKFSTSRTKIPMYILRREAQKRNISIKDLQWYLTHIHYHINNKGRKSLKLFLRKVTRLRD